MPWSAATYCMPLPAPPHPQQPKTLPAAASPAAVRWGRQAGYCRPTHPNTYRRQSQSMTEQHANAAANAILQQDGTLSTDEPPRPTATASVASASVASASVSASAAVAGPPRVGAAPGVRAAADGAAADVGAGGAGGPAAGAGGGGGGSRLKKRMKLS